MSDRICRKCHKKSSRAFCKACEKDKVRFDATEQRRLDRLREKGWIPPEHKPIRNSV